jgi:nucleotide-binding universal stress UspA family protein
MATPVQPTTTLNVDQAVYEVAKMSPEIQQMVRYFDEWRQVEADKTSEILMARNALQNLQNQLLATIQKEREEAVKKAEALGVIPTPPQDEIVEVAVPAAKKSKAAK